MRNLNYIVLGFASLFAATVLAQTLNTDVHNRTIAQVGGQAGQTSDPNPMGGQDRMGSQGPTGSGGADRMNEGKTSDPATSPMHSDKDKAKRGYRTQGRNAGPARSDPYQGKKAESSNSGE